MSNENVMKITWKMKVEGNYVGNVMKMSNENVMKIT